MVFSSLLFLLIFLPVTVGLYYLLPGKGKNILLLLVSLMFYAWGEPLHVFIMLVTTLYIWGLGLLTARYKDEGNDAAAKVCMILSLVFSLGTLFFFKYTGFFVSNLPFLQGTALDGLKVALPIGISFYTFQSLSYIIDVYRGDVKAQRSWIDFAMYISLFPQLIAGPIVRYTDVEKQLARRKASYDDIAAGIQRFTFGLGKKVVLANGIGAVWEYLSGSTSMLGAWLAAICFALQIYFDFSAYSDMAIGLGRMFGFRFPENFCYPYQSASVTEFWRRWHITLSVWFREYVYIPLGGNRRGKGRQILNLLIVWFLTGFWHGAAWQFILWGLYYFAWLMLEKLFLLEKLKKLPGAVQHLYALLAILLGWVLFACTDVSAAGSMYAAMLCIGVPIADNMALFALRGCAVLLALCIIGSTEYPRNIARNAGKQLPYFVHCLVVFLILFVSMACLVSDSYNPFLYFRF